MESRYRVTVKNKKGIPGNLVFYWPFGEDPHAVAGGNEMSRKLSVMVGVHIQIEEQLGPEWEVVQIEEPSGDWS